MPIDSLRDKAIVDCTASLAIAIHEAGGSTDSVLKCALNMTVMEFISHHAGNGIRFEWKRDRPVHETEDEDDENLEPLGDSTYPFVICSRPKCEQDPKTKKRLPDLYYTCTDLEDPGDQWEEDDSESIHRFPTRAEARAHLKKYAAKQIPNGYHTPYVQERDV